MQLIALRLERLELFQPFKLFEVWPLGNMVEAGIKSAPL